MMDARWIWTAQEIRAYREKRGWSLEDMACVVGYTVSKVKGMEAGQEPIQHRCAWTLYLVEELRKAMTPGKYGALVRSILAGTIARVQTKEEMQALRHQWDLTQGQMGRLMGYHWMKVAHMEQGLFPIHPRCGLQVALLKHCRAYLPLWYRLLQVRGL